MHSFKTENHRAWNSKSTSANFDKMNILDKGNSEWEGWGTALKPALEPITVARKPLEKGLNVAENCLKWEEATQFYTYSPWYVISSDCVMMATIGPPIVSHTSVQKPKRKANKKPKTTKKVKRADN